MPSNTKVDIQTQLTLHYANRLAESLTQFGIEFTDEVKHDVVTTIRDIIVLTSTGYEEHNLADFPVRAEFIKKILDFTRARIDRGYDFERLTSSPLTAENLRMDIQDIVVGLVADTITAEKYLSTPSMQITPFKLLSDPVMMAVIEMFHKYSAALERKIEELKINTSKEDMDEIYALCKGAVLRTIRMGMAADYIFENECGYKFSSSIIGRDHFEKDLVNTTVFKSLFQRFRGFHPYMFAMKLASLGNDYINKYFGQFVPIWNSLIYECIITGVKLEIKGAIDFDM